MPDTLKEMEDKLQTYKSEYILYKEYYGKEESEGGQVITASEQEDLVSIENSINAIEGKIKEHRALYSTIKIDDVRDHYSLLLNKINDFISNNLDSTYLKWQVHIFSSGNSYATAVHKHETTVNNLKKHKADIANIAGSILFVAGAGTLSWLSSLDKLQVVLKGLSEAQENVLEDVVQGSWDKVVSYSASQSNNSIQTSFDSPLVFQNTIALKALKAYQAVREEILKQAGACIEKEALLLDLQTKDEGNAKAEYEKYIMFESGVVEAIENASNWAQNLPAETGGGYYTSLAEDLERALWAKWLPGLITVDYGPFGLGFNGVDVGIDSWLWTDELCERLTDLIDLDAIGVGENGLDNWVSNKDVTLLVSWAKSFEQTVIF